MLTEVVVRNLLFCVENNFDFLFVLSLLELGLLIDVVHVAHLTIVSSMLLLAAGRGWRKNVALGPKPRDTNPYLTKLTGIQAVDLDYQTDDLSLGLSDLLDDSDIADELKVAKKVCVQERRSS